jgi:nitrite reductase (NO-forming)
VSDATPPAEEPTPDTASRRAFLRRAGVGGAAFLGGVAAQRVLPAPAVAAEPGGGDPHASHGGARIERPSIGAGGGPSGPISESNTGTGSIYGHVTEPPAGMGDRALDAVTLPPSFDGRPAGVTREYELVVTEQHLRVGGDAVVDGWVYGGSAPGPILRATEGDTLRITLHNRTSHPHNLHLHGRHSPQADGWEPIAPGASTTYELVAAPFGVHPYHCHVPPLAEHIARGLFGMLIVDPPGGRPPAHEVVLVLNGWDLDGDGVNDLYAFNGVAGFFHTYPIKVPVGELVRAYVCNMTEYDLLGSFHLHAQTFDVFWQGTSLEPDLHGDVVTLAQADRAVLEFTLPERGRYMFHPHQHHMADRGAMGWFAAI